MDLGFTIIPVPGQSEVAGILAQMVYLLHVLQTVSILAQMVISLINCLHIGSHGISLTNCLHTGSNGISLTNCLYNGFKLCISNKLSQYWPKW
jgi:hypothetical protein